MIDDDAEWCTHCNGGGVDPEHGDICSWCEGTRIEPKHKEDNDESNE